MRHGRLLISSVVIRGLMSMEVVIYEDMIGELRSLEKGPWNVVKLSWDGERDLPSISQARKH